MSQALNSVTEYLSLIRALFPWLWKPWEPSCMARCFSYSHSVSLALPVSLLPSPSLPLSFEGLLSFLSHSLSASHDNKWDMKPIKELSIYSNSQLHLLSIRSARGPTVTVTYSRWNGLPATNTLTLPVAQTGD